MEVGKGGDVHHELRHIPTVVRGHLAEQEAGHETDVVLLDAGAAHLEKDDMHGLKLARDNHTVCFVAVCDTTVLT